MSLIVLSYGTGFSGGDKAYGARVLQDLQDIVNVVNGQLDDANIAAAGLTLSTVGKAGSITSSLLGSNSVGESAINFDGGTGGALVPRLGPTAALSWRIAPVSKTVTLAASAGWQSFTITFSTDAMLGNPAFTGTPVVIGGPVAVSPPSTGEVPDKAYISGLSPTGCTLNINYATAPAATNVTFHITFMGTITP